MKGYLKFQILVVGYRVETGVSVGFRTWDLAVVSLEQN